MSSGKRFESTRRLSLACKTRKNRELQMFVSVALSTARQQ